MKHLKKFNESLNFHFPEYEMIKSYYGSKVANRSKVPLINHINEGLLILEWISASDYAKRAYCLHPMFQSDDDLLKNYESNLGINQRVFINVMEYRHIANDYLSKRKINGLEDIRLSLLKDVNDMLIADKVQNRKDFERFHLGKHERSSELDQYFKNWLSKLGVSEETYQEYLIKLNQSL